ncbi:methyl-accepting chemotaxis protein [Bacteriovorax sp. Seq25_V]|uniref:methyl-accepting chemotaxis protein n=1 Tax=Bacteriovorax sp. Seq25_V TaxID=1201288 RepID=UPI000389E998|nr:methyl-accepting chemotaxis protein [Bacteriovorax sp. Seq25_V]EQC45384.1 methyl-accepting chemotaxis protein signaling domain protein [Bacteriovorax sp. Seq25_V]
MKLKSLKVKLLILVFGAFVPIILGLLFYIIPSYESFFVEQKKVEIKTAIEVVIGMLHKIDARVQSGEITYKQAQAETQQLFKTLRYGDKDYFFAYQNGIGMAHGLKDEIVGQDRSNSIDANGKNYMSNFKEIEKAEGTGYVDYQFERRKGEAPEDKISYIAYFKPWKWIIGTGVYTSAIQEQMSNIKQKIYIGIAIIALLTLVISVLFSIQLNKQLTNISNGLKEESDSIDQVARKLSSISESLSSSTTQQASALQETSSSVEETSAMIERNSQNARESIKISHKSQQSVNEGKDSINRMMTSIQDIANSNTEIVNQIDESNKELENIVRVINEIGEKTKVINDIVFQTKLLSFNASVEAARAGEQGKGFAVVAEEVGNLATMSGNSANEISEMLEKSIQQVETTIKHSKERIANLVGQGEQKVKSGLKIADECISIFDHIVFDVNKVTEMVEEISTASGEQSNGVREINLAVTELDSVAQQNSTMSQDTAHTSEQLRRQVVTLKEMTDNLNKTIAG